MNQASAESKNPVTSQQLPIGPRIALSRHFDTPVTLEAVTGRWDPTGPT
jgi:hypothetical protein